MSLSRNETVPRATVNKEGHADSLLVNQSQLTFLENLQL